MAADVNRPRYRLEHPPRTAPLTSQRSNQGPQPLETTVNLALVSAFAWP